MTPGAALARLGAAPGWRVLGPVGEGAVAACWRLTADNGEEALLRIDGPRAATLGLDRRREHAVLEAVAVAGLGPAPLAADPEAGLLLRRWLPGKALRPAALAVDIEALGALLARLHALPVDTAPVDLPAVIARYAAAAGPAWQGPARALIARLAAEPAAGHCLCHHDVHAANVIRGVGGLCLIDWEYAGCADPWFDRATLARELPSEAHEAWLTACLGRAPGEEDRARLGRWMETARALAALWAAAAVGPG